MADPVALCVAKLAELSDHFRLLADLMTPEPVSAEIAAVANEYDNEIARLQRESGDAPAAAEGDESKQAA